MNREYTVANQWVASAIIINGAPEGAEVECIQVSWNVDSNDVETVYWYISNEDGTIELPYPWDILTSTGNDILDGYDETSDNNYNKTFNIPSGIQANDTWYFNIADFENDFDPDLNKGRIDSWSITITYVEETIDTASAPSGNSSGVVGQSLTFSTNAQTNLGHTLEYRFWWDDGTVSAWGSSSQSHTYTNEGVYYVAVDARCKERPSVVSEMSNVKTVTISALMPPTNVQATDRTDADKIGVTWDNSLGATSYEVWRNTTNNSGSATWIANSAPPYDDTGATPERTYYYWIKAKNPYTSSGFSTPDTGYRQGSTWYVDADVDSSGNGTSWSEAFETIQEAIDAASEGHEIWVKMGTYSLTSQINVNKAIDIYGGFAGTETQRDQRDWANNITTVDGQDSVYHCFYVTGDVTIDGFTITGGTALFSYPHGRGGGMHIFNSSATIANCILWGNPAQSVQEIYKGVSSYPTVIFCNVKQDGYAGSNGNIREDPLFVDPENGDFHLKASSPCIDAGTNDAPGLPATDFDGYVVQFRYN